MILLAAYDDGYGIGTVRSPLWLSDPDLYKYVDELCFGRQVYVGPGTRFPASFLQRHHVVVVTPQELHAPGARLPSSAILAGGPVIWDAGFHHCDFAAMLVVPGRRDSESFFPETCDFAGWRWDDPSRIGHAVLLQGAK